MHAAVDEQRAVSKAGFENGVARCSLHSPRQWKLQEATICSTISVPASMWLCRGAPVVLGGKSMIFHGYNTSDTMPYGG